MRRKAKPEPVWAIELRLTRSYEWKYNGTGSFLFSADDLLDHLSMEALGTHPSSMRLQLSLTYMADADCKLVYDAAADRYRAFVRDRYGNMYLRPRTVGLCAGGRREVLGGPAPEIWAKVKRP